MRSRQNAVVSVVAALFTVWSGCTGIRELEAEQPETIRVGDLAALRVDSDRGYSVGGAGESMILKKRTEEGETTLYVYRAVAPGRHTFVLTPRDPGADGCVSCVTVHYFVTVVK